MSILLFNRSRMFPYQEWLSDLNDPLVLFTQVELKHSNAYDKVIKKDAFDHEPLTEWEAVELHQEYRFRKVIGHSEYDLIRTARLREKFGLDGQDLNSAVAYRDKVVMKEHAVRAGIAVPEFKRVESVLDLLNFADNHGYPLVIKPADGGGSRNTKVVRDRAQMRDYVANGLMSGLMVEVFVEGEMYHVDGLFHQGDLLFACASRYINGCLAFQTGSSLGSVLLDPADERNRRLCILAEQVIRALPAAPTVAFHAEFFHTPDDRLLLCEIASRTGGARVVDTINTAFNIDLNRHWVRLQCGIEESVTPTGEGLAGWLVVPPRPGKLLSLPERVPFDWVTDYMPMIQPGAVTKHAVSSVDNIANFVVTGPSEAVIETRLLELEDWFHREIVLEENGVDEEVSSIGN